MSNTPNLERYHQLAQEHGLRADLMTNEDLLTLGPSWAREKAASSSASVDPPEAAELEAAAAEPITPAEQDLADSTAPELAMAPGQVSAETATQEKKARHLKSPDRRARQKRRRADSKAEMKPQRSDPPGKASTPATTDLGISAGRPSPAFQFYPADWLASQKIALMPPEYEGAYIRLLCYAWKDPDCSLPDDDETLARLSRLGERWSKAAGRVVRKCFVLRNGRLYNERLLLERKRQEEWRIKSRKGGVKSGSSRRNTRSARPSNQSSSSPKGGSPQRPEDGFERGPTVESKGDSSRKRRVVPSSSSSSSSSSVRSSSSSELGSLRVVPPLTPPKPKPEKTPKSSRVDDDEKPEKARRQFASERDELAAVIEEATGERPDEKLIWKIREAVELRGETLRSYIDDIRPRLKRLTHKSGPGFFYRLAKDGSPRVRSLPPAEPAFDGAAQFPCCKGTGKTAAGGFCACKVGETLAGMERLASKPTAADGEGPTQ